MGETSSEVWKRFVDEERLELRERRDGRALREAGFTMPGESSEELERWALEDRLRAEAGLVNLVLDGKVFYKHIDELTPGDGPALAEAHEAKIASLHERAKFLGNHLARMQEHGLGKEESWNDFLERGSRRPR